MADQPAGQEASLRLEAEERAEVVVTRLERFIRDHRTLSRGVSFRKWQDMAKAEIAEIIREVHVDHSEDNRSVERTLMLLGAGMATVGVWGSALFVLTSAPGRLVAAVLSLVGGVLVLWAAGALGLRSPLKRFQVNSTRRGLGRVRTLNQKVVELENHLKKRKKSLEQEIDSLPEE